MEKVETIEYNTSENLIQSFIEDWNDLNPGKVLDPVTIDLFTNYLRIAYVGGWDDHRLIIERILKSSGQNMSKYFFEKRIKEFEEEI